MTLAHDVQSSLEEYLLALGDDELVLGQRDSEWCGRAPILEEDIAFANLALDELGHAAIWYTLLAELRGEDLDAYPDKLIYERPAAEFRNVQLVELPRGDWAFSMLRQYLFDAAEVARLESLKECAYAPLAAAAEKIFKEELYHLRHTRLWVERLGLGSDESHRRMQAALDSQWPYTAQLFARTPAGERLEAQGILPAVTQARAAWEAQVLPLLDRCGLSRPVSPGTPAVLSAAPARSEHTPHLALLVEELQSVARLEPGATW